MKCVTYNVHFGVGMDGQYDLARIADAVRGADLIALQEVSRNNPQNGSTDMVSGLCALFPDYFTVFGTPYQVNIGSHMDAGKAVSVYFEFGNMVLSKTPIISSRNLLLPRRRTRDVLNLQRGALETMIDTPAGVVRFYNVHLDHVSGTERLAQTVFLKERVTNYQDEGGAVTGLASIGFPEPPHPEHAVLMGDFNFPPDSPEYTLLCGTPEPDGFVDIAATGNGTSAPDHTWFDPEGKKLSSRIDYCFATASLAGKCGKARVDQPACGSDHCPLWFEIG